MDDDHEPYISVLSVLNRHNALVTQHRGLEGVVGVRGAATPRTPVLVVTP